MISLIMAILKIEELEWTDVASQPIISKENFHEFSKVLPLSYFGTDGEAFSEQHI